jgi:hypothetical protein
MREASPPDYHGYPRQETIHIQTYVPWSVCQQLSRREKSSQDDIINET